MDVVVQAMLVGDVVAQNKLVGGVVAQRMVLPPGRVHCMALKSTWYLCLFSEYSKVVQEDRRTMVGILFNSFWSEYFATILGLLGVQNALSCVQL